MSRTTDIEDLLESIIDSINLYNKPDMLVGYLNPLAEEFNQRLESLELATIQVVDAEYTEE